MSYARLEFGSVPHWIKGI